MKRIAILGGGISGLTAAYELELARQRGAEIDWHLYEATNRLGGILETTTQGDFILEGGPDGWVTEKPWARDLAIELGLEKELIVSNDATKKTYIYINGQLQPMPAKMRMMVPENLAMLQDSALFSDGARAAYAAELANAEALKTSAPQTDESVASFVLRHFGEEVLTKIAAPLLSGIFGGDVHKLSVRAVMPAFVKMEQEHGSLILALQERTKSRGSKPPQPTFTSLKQGMGSLTAAILAILPPERLHFECPVVDTFRDVHDNNIWHVTYDAPDAHESDGTKFLWDGEYAHVIFATPLDVTRSFLRAAEYDLRLDRFLPCDASSAVLATFVWSVETASTFTMPSGFGFLVPNKSSVISTGAERSGETRSNATENLELLACTFANQKFPYRAPAGARILRAFFGGASANALASQPDAAVAEQAFTQLAAILGPLPQPDAALTTVHRWPRSLPQYEVGHLDRMAQLDEHVSRLGNLTLLGNSYRGVGVPDLIRDARAAARAFAER